MPPKKCTSICTKKKELHECNSDPRCKYANGKLRKYCYLSNKYTFDDKCNIITKVSKNNPIKLPRTRRTRSLPKSEEPMQQLKINYIKKKPEKKTNNKKNKKQTIKKIDPFNIINGYSSSNSSKHVKRDMKRRPFSIIESDTPIQLNPFNFIKRNSSSNSSKRVKRNTQRKPRYIINSSSS
jgi:hypothetical protein